MKLTRTIGTASGTAIAAIALLLLLPTLNPSNDTATAQPAPHPSSPSATLAPASPVPASPAPEISTPAGKLLAEIPELTTTEAPPYDRAMFGQRWADTNRNGCDTRNDILARDLTDTTFKPGTHDCVVTSGTLHDAYTGETVTFTRVSQGYQPVQIDHIIPLKVAWSAGAYSWTDQQRLQLANDPAELLTTTANQSKGDSTPAKWMPAGATEACTYATRYITVAHTYQLGISNADRTALAAALTGCPTNQ